jgi:hypothetical protein
VKWVINAGMNVDAEKRCFRQNAPAGVSLTRLTYPFSKKEENLQAAVASHVEFYNFCRIHGSLQITSAMTPGHRTMVGRWRS